MIVLYTAIFGKSDSLKAAPKGPRRCVCFTDDPILAASGFTGEGWEIILSADWGATPRAAARNVKTLSHDLFHDADATVWVDGSIQIKDWPLLMEHCGDASVACLAHPDRSNCYDEARLVVRLERANPSKVAEAIDIYRAEGFASTSLSTTGLMYRRNDPKVAAMNRLWRANLDRFGVNDQVHFDYCAWKTGVPVRHLTGHYRDNPYALYDRLDHHNRRQPQFKPYDRCDHYLA